MNLLAIALRNFRLRRHKINLKWTSLEQKKIKFLKFHITKNLIVWKWKLIIMIVQTYIIQLSNQAWRGLHPVQIQFQHRTSLPRWSSWSSLRSRAETREIKDELEVDMRIKIACKLNITESWKLTSSMVLKSFPVSSFRACFSSLGLADITVLRS